MILSNYTQTQANRLNKLSISDINEPIPIKVLWLNTAAVTNTKLFGNKTHKHSFFETHFLLSGSIEYETSTENKYHILAGNGIMFSPNTSHAISSFTNDMKKISLTFYCEKPHPFFEQLSQKRICTFVIDEKMKKCFETILDEAALHSVFSSALIKNCIFELICRIMRSANVDEKNEKISEYQPDLRIDAVKQYIKDNSCIFLTCQDVAQYCHYNVKYLNRIFKNKTGMTLLEYIHKTKIKQAEYYLENTTISLKEISTLLGFANEYYFNSFFKRYIGISPSSYRVKINAKC